VVVGKIQVPIPRGRDHQAGIGELGHDQGHVAYDQACLSCNGRPGHRHHVVAALAASERGTGAMTTTPDVPVPDHDENPDAPRPQPERAPGVEIGTSEERSTFEPEEDPEAQA
jgi:hypothetical protein